MFTYFFQFVFPFEPVPVARRRNCCMLEGMRTASRTTREPPIKLRRFDLQYLTPTIKQVQLCPMTKRQKYKKMIIFLLQNTFPANTSKIFWTIRSLRLSSRAASVKAKKKSRGKISKKRILVLPGYPDDFWLVQKQVRMGMGNLTFQGQGVFSA